MFVISLFGCQTKRDFQNRWFYRSLRHPSRYGSHCFVCLFGLKTTNDPILYGHVRLYASIIRTPAVSKGFGLRDKI